MTLRRYFAFYGQKTRIPQDSHIFVCYSQRLPSGPGPSDPDHLTFFCAIKDDLSLHSHRPTMTVPRFLAVYDHKSRIPSDSYILECYSPRLPNGPSPPDPDRLKIFRAINYDLRNHNHHPAMIVPHFLHFMAKKLEFRPILIFSCAIVHAFRVGWVP